MPSSSEWTVSAVAAQPTKHNTDDKVWQSAQPSAFHCKWWIVNHSLDHFADREPISTANAKVNREADKNLPLGPGRVCLHILFKLQPHIGGHASELCLIDYRGSVCIDMAHLCSSCCMCPKKLSLCQVTLQEDENDTIRIILVLVCRKISVSHICPRPNT